MNSFYKKIHLKNPYELKERSLLVHLYSIYPNLNNISLKALFYIPNVMINCLGFYLLSIKKCKYLKATHKDSSLNFEIRDTNSQFHSIYFKKYENGYEPDVSAILKIFLKKNGTLIDIGSNWGHHSIVAAIEKECKVILFEPNPEIFSDIIRIREQLRLTKKITPFNIGLSNKKFSGVIEQKYFESGSVSIIKDFIKNKFIYEIIYKFIFTIFLLKKIRYKIKCEKLDAFSFKNISMIKIDAEGFELPILKGGIKTIKKNRPGIIFEFHSSKNSFLTFESFFKKIKYRLYEIKITQERRIFRVSFHKLTNLNKDKIYNIYACPGELTDKMI